MLNTLKAAAVVATIGFAVPAQARPVNVEVAMNPYSGQQAYMAAYIVDASGQYVATIMTAGSRSKYLADLSRWCRMFQRAGGRVDGTSGASIGSGQSMQTQVDIPDAMLNAGYTLRIETAVENQRYFPDEAAVVLEDATNGKPVAGAGFVQSVTVAY